MALNKNNNQSAPNAPADPTVKNQDPNEGGTPPNEGDAPKGDEGDEDQGENGAPNAPADPTVKTDGKVSKELLDTLASNKNIKTVYFDDFGNWHLSAFPLAQIGEQGESITKLYANGLEVKAVKVEDIGR